MMQRWKIPILYALCVLLAVILPVTARAADADLMVAPKNGECSATDDDHVMWTLDNYGTLTISGTGEMEDRYSDKGWDALRYEITSVIIENGVENIGSYAFDNLPFLTSVTISETVKTIGIDAFNNCTMLETVTMKSGVEVIGSGAFYSCYELTDFMLPDTLNVMEEAAFSSCYALRNVIIPDSVRHMGNSIYSGCNLTSLVFGKRITVIPSSTLSGCNTIKTIVIPDNIRVIEPVFAWNDDAKPVIYYAGTQAQWNALNGDGRSDLTERASRIYFENTGSDDAAPMTYEITVIMDHLDYVDFSINANGNSVETVRVIAVFYNERQQFMYADSRYIRFDTDNNSDNLRYWCTIDGKTAKTVKLFILDENWIPLCPCATGTFQTIPAQPESNRT